MKICCTLILIHLLTISGIAQNQNYTAKVLDTLNQPLPGATIHMLGTDNYAVTDDKGAFTIHTDKENFTLKISSIGFRDRLINVTNGKMPATIKLQMYTKGLNEVVVTALGLEREKQSLGSAVTTLQEEQLTEVPQTNIVNSLSGLVAGVQTTNGSSGTGSSSRIIIRGENSLSSANQPLFVVDGVPIRNRQIGSELINDGSFQEVDFGNGSADISPSDIASISILKGPGSAALYGSRAANGVVLIAIKEGKQSSGLNVSTSSTLTFETPLTMPDYQNQYGSGSLDSNNNPQYVFENGIGGGIADGGIASFGVPLDQGYMTPQFDGPSVDVNGNPVRGGDVIARTRPDGSYTEITPTKMISRPDNVRNFFETGLTSQNNIAISAANEETAVRASYSNLRNKGMLPNTDLNRDGFSLSLNQKLDNSVSIDLFANYINSRSDNRPNLGYGYENVMYGFNWTGRQANIEAMRDYWQAGQEGIQHFDINYLWLTNPYLTLYENTNSFNKNRVLGNASVNYEINKHFELRVRSGVDLFNEGREFRRAFSTNRKPFGGYRVDNIRYREINTDLLLTYKNRISPTLKYRVAAGANRFDQKINYQYSVADQLAIPGIYTLENSRVALSGSSQEYQKRINSLYALGNINYRNLLYLDLTYRNDWSSTLPEDNNSYGYFSVAVSSVISRVMELPDAITYAKLRLSAASVGNDTDPYQLNNTFRFNSNYSSYFRVTNSEILKNANLKPERLNAYELGAEIWLLNDHLQLDVALYQNTSINQIIGRPISFATGFSNVVENGGEVRTRGLEARLSASIIENDDFQWQSSVNYSVYRSAVTRLPEGVSQYVTGEAKIFGGGGGSNTVFYIAKEGGRVGDMYGTGFVQVDGETLYGPNGLPVQDNTLRLLGNYNPDFIVGFRNQFSYKNFSLSFLVDWRYGGTIISRSKALGSTSGVLKETLNGREDGITGAGVVNVGSDENPAYEPNTTVVPASQFYNNFYDRGNEASALYNASYIKLRQVSFYYDLPKRFCSAIGFQNLKVGLIGSNLLLFTENPHFDPELNAMEGPLQTYGVEDMSYPSARSFGVILKTKI